MKHLKAFLLRRKVALLNMWETRFGRKPKYKHALLNNGYPIDVVRQRSINMKK
jgi:hypothetical protein